MSLPPIIVSIAFTKLSFAESKLQLVLNIMFSPMRTKTEYNRQNNPDISPKHFVYPIFFKTNINIINSVDKNRVDRYESK